MTIYIKNIKILKKKINKKKLVFSSGCFDVFHVGHLIFLKEFAKFPGVKILAINTDKSIKKIKGKNRPINIYKNRVRLIKLLNLVDYIIPLNYDTPEKMIKLFKPDIFVKGKENTSTFSRKLKIYKIIRKYSKRIKYINLVNQMSSTSIISRVKKIYDK